MDSPEQKFFVSDDGKEKLSITKAELQAGIDSGKYGEKTLAWTKGMSGWLPLSDPSWEKHGIVLEPEPPELPNPIEDKTPQSSPNAQADSQPFQESKELPGTNPVAERQVPKSKLRFLKDALKAAWIIGLVYVGGFALITLQEYAIGDLSLMEYAFGDSPNLENTETLEKIIAEAIDENKLQVKGNPLDFLPKRHFALNEQTPYTGWVKKMWSNGQIKEIYQLKDGMVDGLASRWYKNGQKEFVQKFKNGKLISVQEAWNPDGIKCPYTNVTNGSGKIAIYSSQISTSDPIATQNYRDGIKVDVKFH